MGALRLKVGKDLGLTDESKWAPLWVIDFPMFEDDGEGGLTAMHLSLIHILTRKIGKAENSLTQLVAKKNEDQTLAIAQVSQKRCV